MKAISLYQPWAALVAIGAKQWETRGRKTHHRGEIAIHAGMSKQCFDIASQEPFISALELHIARFQDGLELGGIVAVADITEVITTTEWTRRYCTKKAPNSAGYGEELEYAFGDYSPGRFAWKLENVRRIHPFIPTRGRQWIWNLPEDVEREVRSRLLP